VIVELKKARQLLVNCGWAGPEVEPMCSKLDGSLCWEWDEGVASFSVQGALIETGAYPDGWYALEAVLSPSRSKLDAFKLPEPIAIDDVRRFQALCRSAVDEPELQAWLQDPSRTKDDVLRAFVKAIERSKKGERR
jgi:hypothetical protein